MSTEPTAEAPRFQKTDGSEYQPWGGIHYAWWILGLLMFQFIVDGAWSTAGSVMYPTFIAAWGWTAGMIKNPMGVAFLIHAAMAWLVGYTWDHWIRFGKNRMTYIVMAGYVCEVLIALALSQWLSASTNWLWWIAQILFHCISPWYAVLPILAITNWFSTRRGLVLGLVGSGGQGGTPLIWGWLSSQLMKPYTIIEIPTPTGVLKLVQAAGIRFVWRVAALTVIPIIPLYFFFWKTWPHDKGIRAFGAPPWNEDEKFSRERKEIPPEWNWGYTLGEAVRTKPFWLLFAGILLSPFFWYIEMGGYTIHGGNVLALPIGTVGLGMTLYGWWLAVQGGMLGHIFDWRGWDKRFAVAWGPLLGVSVAGLVLYLWKAAGGYLLGGPLIACGVGAWFGMIAATYVNHFGPRAMGMVYNVGCRFNTYVALAAALFYGGWLYDKYHVYAPEGIGWIIPSYMSNIWYGLICTVIICLAVRPTLDMYARLKNPPPFARDRRAELEADGQL